MEFLIGQKVRIRPKYENNGNRGKIYEILKAFEKKLLLGIDGYHVIISKHKLYDINVEKLIVVSNNCAIVELERLEAAFYEYFENIHDNSEERNKEVQETVEELMNVVKSVSINE